MALFTGIKTEFPGREMDAISGRGNAQRGCGPSEGMKRLVAGLVFLAWSMNVSQEGLVWVGVAHGPSAI